jgi:hypothetical protein
MKKRFVFMALLAALTLPHLAQAQVRLSLSDQQRFDSYYSRWQSYKATNNQSEVRSMEGRMQDVYRHYGIPANTPYGNVASGGGGTWRNGGWNGSPSQSAGGDWNRDHDRYHDRDWHSDHDRYRDHDWDRDRDWHHARYRNHDWDRHRDRDDDRDEDGDRRHDRGRHRGWYKHDRDHDHDDHDIDHDHHR